MTTGLFGSVLLALSAANPLLQMGGIILAALILEDTAILLTAMRVADGTVSAPLALAALYLGVTLGDLGLYGIGRAAERHPWAARFLDRPRVEQVRSWLGDRLLATIFVTRCTPGTRLPTYLACGFLRADFARFALGVILATLFWTSLLFSAAVLLGNYVLVQLGSWGWLAALGIVPTLLLLGRGVTFWRSRGVRLCPTTE